MSRCARLLLLLALAPGAAACTEKVAKLHGSIGELYPLDFNEVRLRKQETDLVIDYLREVDRTVEKPCRLVVETAELNLSPPVEVTGANFAASVHLGRVMVNGETFPAIDQGELELRAFDFRGGGKVDGEFFVMFAGGRDLYGTFSGEVQEVVGE